MSPKVQSARLPSGEAIPLAHLQAELPREMIERAFQRLTPLKIHMAEPSSNKRWLELHTPAEIEFVPGKGIRIVTTGSFRFELAKVPIPAHLDRIEFLLTPRIIAHGEDFAAAIPIEIIQADLRMIPDVIDDLLVAQVNRALTPRASQLVWRLSDTLSAEFEMPERLAQLKALDLSVEHSQFEVTAESVKLKVAYRLKVERHPNP